MSAVYYEQPLNPQLIRQNRHRQIEALEEQLKAKEQQIDNHYEAQRRAVEIRSQFEQANMEADMNHAKEQGLYAAQNQLKRQQVQIEYGIHENYLQLEKTALELSVQARLQKLQKKKQDLEMKAYKDGTPLIRFDFFGPATTTMPPITARTITQ
jgi:hypothetical protein